jgi:DNA adenine methylase
MHLKALAPWFGAKRTIAPRVVEALGNHSLYFEPFCGSLAVLLAKPRARMEVVNDLHGGLVNLARVVQSDSLAPRLYDRLARTAFSKALLEDALARHVEGTVPAPPWPDLDRAYDYMVLSWMGRNGLAGTLGEEATGFCVRYTGGGGDPAVRWRNAAESLPGWWDRLRSVTILNEDALGLIPRFEDTPEAVLYADPPYLVEGGEYLHGLAADGHARLSEGLRRFDATRVVLSYYDDPRLGEWYVSHGWRRVEVEARRHMGGGSRGKAPEVLLLNPAAQAARGGTR